MNKDLDLKKISGQSKSEWEEAAKVILKGKTLDSLKWKVDDQIYLDPIYTSQEINSEGSSTNNQRSNNHWLIGERFDGSDQAQTNTLLLRALEEGLDSPQLEDLEEHAIGLDSVRLDYIFPFFRGGDLDTFLSWIEKEDYELEKLNGAFQIVEDQINNSDIKKLNALQNLLPKYYHTFIHFENNVDDLGKGLSLGLINLEKAIHDLMSNGIEPRAVCTFELEADFIKNIALIRALRFLIGHICQEYEFDPRNIIIDAQVFESSMDLQLGMIGACSKATAAVTGGVDRLTIECESMNVTLEEIARRRMTRNVHHVMKLESGMEKVVDPAAGSYMIEKLTQEIAKRAWKTFTMNTK